jgi:hypothetical protein
MWWNGGPKKMCLLLLSINQQAYQNTCRDANRKKEITN